MVGPSNTSQFARLGNPPLRGLTLIFLQRRGRCRSLWPAGARGQRAGRGRRGAAEPGVAASSAFGRTPRGTARRAMHCLGDRAPTTAARSAAPSRPTIRDAADSTGVRRRPARRNVTSARQAGLPVSPMSARRAARSPIDGNPTGARVTPAEVDARDGRGHRIPITAASRMSRAVSSISTPNAGRADAEGGGGPVPFLLVARIPVVLGGPLQTCFSIRHGDATSLT